SLKRGVRFSNGREVRAEDFKYSFERLLSPKTLSPNSWVLSRIEGAKDFMKGSAPAVKGIIVRGPYALDIKLEKPFSPFPYLLAMTGAYVVPREVAQSEGPDFSSRPVGTGPFTVQKWQPNEELVLKARDDYFGGRPKVKGIVYRIIPEELTQVVEFKLGNLDVINIPDADYSRFRTDSKWSRYISMADGTDTYYLGLNCSRPPFNDRRMRQAVNYAIDRKKILATFMEGRGTLANGPVPPELRRWASPPSYEYNPEKARRIIRQEGFAGVKVKFYVTSPPQDIADMAEIIQAYLKKVGINAELKSLEWNTYKEAINQGEPNMFWLSWWADYPDAENFLYPLFDSVNMGAAGNRTRYSNKEVDHLIEQGQHASTAASRDGYYKEAEDLIVKDAPWVFFWHTKSVTVRQPWIKNYVQYPVYSMDKGMDISIVR
nr:ABC transporter substrate-binding protein [Nitrospiraceae bacterium]